jgi:hypothetical protein
VEGPSAIDSGKPWSTLPAGYASEITPTSMLVNLIGEPVTLRTVAPIGALPHPRELRVRVTERGAAAPGVPVVLGAHLRAMWSHLSAEAGGVTDTRGELVVRVPDDATWALALGPRGWSRITPIEGDTVTVVLEPAAGLEVIATEDGAPFPADISIVSGGLHVAASSPDGRFTFAALPPGPAEVTVTAQRQFATGSDHAPAHAVELVPDRVTPLTIDLSGAGALIAVIPSLPDGEEASTVEHFLLAPPAPTSIDAVRAATNDFRLLGGRDAMNTYEHERVPPGTHVVCAIAAIEGADLHRFACATVEVRASGIAEVPLALR